MASTGTLRRVAGLLAALAAGVLILLAVLVGLARLLLPLAPGYQAEIRRFANEATGLDVQFSRLTASWPLRGPAIRFFDVQVRTRDGARNVFDADELAVGVNLFRLVVDRQLLPGRVEVHGARLDVDVGEDRRLLVNGVPLDDLWHPPPGSPMPHLDVDLADITVLARDPSRLIPQVGFRIDSLQLGLAPELVKVRARLAPASDIGRRIDLDGSVPAALLPGAAPADGPLPDWSFRVKGTDLDLARVLRLGLNQSTPLATGTGRLDLRADVSGREPRRVDLDLDASGATVSGDRGSEAYERLAIAFEWTGDGAGWRFALKRFLAQRAGDESPESSGEVSYVAASGERPATLNARADVLAIGDIFPLVTAVPAGSLPADLPRELSGEVRDLSVEARLADGKPVAYQVKATLKDAGFAMPEPGVSLAGFSGTLTAGESGGKLTLDTGPTLAHLPEYFANDLAATRVTGLLSWSRAGQGVDLFGQDIVVTTADTELRGRLHVTLPSEGPALVDASARVQSNSAPAIVTYLPLRLFSQEAADWLRSAVVAGRVPRGEFTWQGPVAGFPYENGGGNFHAGFEVEDGTLAFAPDWPRVEGLAAKIAIDQATLESTENRGTVAGLAFQDARFRIPDLVGESHLELVHAQRTRVEQVLGFAQGSPIAALLGPTLSSVTGSGDTGVDLRLDLPIATPDHYRLHATFAPEHATLGLKDVEFGLTDFTGTLKLDNENLAGDGITARFLDEPVTLSIRPADPALPAESSLSHVAHLEGATPMEKLSAAFALPYADKTSGSMAWRTVVLMPTRASRAPLRLLVDSDLKGVVSRLPAPMEKAADAADPLRMEMSFPETTELDLDGRLQRGVSFALRFISAPKSGWGLERGTINAGRGQAALPAQPGLEIMGDVAAVRFDDWFPGQGTGGKGSGGESLRRILLGAGRFSIFGQTVRDTLIDAERNGDTWSVLLRGPDAEGQVLVPAGADPDAPLVLELDRLWLTEGDPGRGEGQVDPRNLPPVRARIQDFVLNDMHFGKLVAELNQRGDGVIADPLTTESKTFRISGDGAWLVENGDPAKQRSELRFTLNSTDIKPTLAALGYDQMVDGEKAEIEADLVWPGAPGSDFLNVAAGRVTVMMRKGQLLAVEPGSGRVVGLLSVAALPRRLGMDFRDVVDQGLAFDQVKGEFRLEGGNAFTCNLGLEGPTADLGMVGRVGFRTRDYDQLAVVRPHVSDAFALGGALVGGPVIGGAVLLISQLFRKTLSSLGESYYRVSGSWDKPVVTREQASEVDTAPFKDCERYLKDVLRDAPPQPAAAPGGGAGAP